MNMITSKIKQVYNSTVSKAMDIASKAIDKIDTDKCTKTIMTVDNIRHSVMDRVDRIINVFRK